MKQTDRTSFTIFLSVSLIAAATAVVLLLLNFFGFAVIGSDTYTSVHAGSPQEAAAKIADALTRTAHGFSLSDETLVADGCWCVLIDADGDVAWSRHMPADIPAHYTINDVAKFTRWYLNDYPVYVHTSDFGLLVYGIPKNAIGKYQMAYSQKWFKSLPQRLAAILCLNIVLALILARILGGGLYLRIKTITAGLKDLRNEQQVVVREQGIFREIAHSINETSAAMARKNNMLARRETARSNWISGISHDIRTPLSIIMGYSGEMMNETALPEHALQRIKTINAESIRIKKLIEDLNLISSLEYDMQPSQKKTVRICPLLRRAAADAMNHPLAAACSLEMEDMDERAAVLADEGLLSRAIVNLISNSITHNPGGCRIHVCARRESGHVHITIRDGGCGVPAEVLAHIENIPKSAHGMGLPMAYRIIRAHGGRFEAKNENGFFVEIVLADAYS